MLELYTTWNLKSKISAIARNQVTLNDDEATQRRLSKKVELYGKRMCSCWHSLIWRAND